MKIAVGADHAGFPLKEEIVRFLREEGRDFDDFGTHSADRVDYPDYAKAVAEAVARGDYDVGILVCGSGVGMSVAANKVPGIRAALCGDCYTARVARSHNDANILTMGGRVIGQALALEIVKAFLSTPFSGDERHARRIGQIAEMDGSREEGC